MTERLKHATRTVRAGQPVELTLRDDGQSAHDFTLTDGVAQPVNGLGGISSTEPSFVVDVKPRSCRVAPIAPTGLQRCPGRVRSHPPPPAGRAGSRPERPGPAAMDTG